MPYKDPAQQAAYLKKWNKEYYRKNAASVYKRVKARRRAMRNWLDAYKAKLACVKCGENHPACLDFHHTDSKTKDFSVGNVRAWGWGKERMMQEIEKCVILCSNCHRKTHYASRNKR